MRIIRSPARYSSNARRSRDLLIGAPGADEYGEGSYDGEAFLVLGGLK